MSLRVKYGNPMYSTPIARVPIKSPYYPTALVSFAVRKDTYGFFRVFRLKTLGASSRCSRLFCDRRGPEFILLKDAKAYAEKLMSRYMKRRCHG